MNNITQTQAISSLTDFLLHICSSSFTVSVHHSIISNLHIFLSLSFSFLLVAGWWLSYSYRCFLPLCGSHVHTHSKCHIFMTLKNPGVLNWILWHTGTDLFKTHKTKTMPGKLGWMGSQCVTHFSFMHTKKVPVHTIQSCSTIRVTKVVKQTCLI